MNRVLHNRIFQHICFWLMFSILFFFVFRENEPVLVSMKAAAMQLPNMILYTYLQLYVLIPRFLLRRKFLAYLLLSALVTKLCINIAIITMTFFVLPFRTGRPPFMHWDWLWTFNSAQKYPLFGILAVTGLAASIKLLKSWYSENERRKKIEQEKNMVELEMLKAQVHPDFLFKTLNSLHALTVVRSDKAPVVITHLSDLLRYMLYECDEKELSLGKEVGMLKKYLELEKIRYGQNMDIAFSCTGNYGDVMIAPLMLLPFVEHSLKTAAGAGEQSWVNIHLHTEQQELSMNISNSFNSFRKIDVREGLANISKRLELLYAGKYDLSFFREEDMTALKLQLSLASAATPLRPADDRTKLKTAIAL